MRNVKPPNSTGFERILPEAGLCRHEVHFTYRAKKNSAAAQWPGKKKNAGAVCGGTAAKQSGKREGMSRPAAIQAAFWRMERNTPDM
nr:hypothetical protein [uncultured Oscillibacter sp.]